MTTRLNTAKRALRLASSGQNIHALLELNAAVEERPEYWPYWCLRGRVNATLERYLEAIADFTHVLQQPKSVNRRNKIALLEKISNCADKLCKLEKAGLDRTFRKDFGVSSQKIVAGQPSTGKIAQIGKFILDSHDINKIGHLVLHESIDPSKVRRLTVEAAEELNTVLRRIDQNPGVIGSCIICRDGFQYVSTLPRDFDLDSLGICSFGAHINANNISQKMGYGTVGRMLMRSGKNLVLIVDFGVGILVTVVQDVDREDVIQLVATVSELAGYAATPTKGLGYGLATGA